MKNVHDTTQELLLPTRTVFCPCQSYIRARKRWLFFVGNLNEVSYTCHTGCWAHVRHKTYKGVLASERGPPLRIYINGL